ncbi:MAG: hypothetical protein JSV81_06630 [Anaerolineales bacterium]|nr:MAG: hypothetical protein JSV81_06630 [Anaerolineales bacterium]
MERDQKKLSYRQRWDKLRPTKWVLVWFCLGSVIGALIVGFNWGGWVTGGSARDMAVQSGKDAVVERLAPICVYQFTKDPEKDQKLSELKDTSTYQRRAYVEEQGWATMPGEAEPDRNVADACVKLLMQIDQ